MKLAEEIREFEKKVAEDPKEREDFLSWVKSEAHDAVKKGAKEFTVWESNAPGGPGVRTYEWMARVLEEEGFKVSYHKNPADYPGWGDNPYLSVSW